jgi:uncharacterized metal-binding protein YceD (DUF177 family)
MKISIDDIKNAKNQSLKVKFSNEVKELSTEGPVEAELIFTAFDSHINAKGKIVANVKMNCDRCLKDFIEKLELNIDETYSLTSLNSGRDGCETELKDGDFVTELCKDSEVDVEDLIYQTVTLNLPNPSVCDINCVGVPEMEKYIKKENSDPRLDIFKQININKEGK